LLSPLTFSPLRFRESNIIARKSGIADGATRRLYLEGPNGLAVLPYLRILVLVLWIVPGVARVVVVGVGLCPDIVLAERVRERVHNIFVFKILFRKKERLSSVWF
jgi:hypothetical protein